MPEHDNDRLEQFFRKAADRPDVAFNEDDWKKLEARLDALEAGPAAKASNRNGIVTATIVGILLLSGVGIWLGIAYDASTNPAGTTEVSESTDPSSKSQKTVPEALPPLVQHNDRAASEATPREGKENHQIVNDDLAAIDDLNAETEKTRRLRTGTEEQITPRLSDNSRPTISAVTPSVAGQILMDPDKEKIYEQLIKISSAHADKYKQEAVVELSGAEEADTPGVQTMVEEEHASDQEKHVAMPRLSLLLSYAPDFSSTSLEPYSGAGKAFGAVLHYHLRARWSLSAGIIKNQKIYTGDGEDYHPPKGYWKYATNGVIPESIDGSCTILEFPLMVQYKLLHAGKNRVTVGAGTSSYLMQSESYRYHFSEPNPGAKEGWESVSSSRFYFNMLNVTAGYERQVTTGLAFGIEPYIKLPLEEIGWSNLKLYSMGASITMRYTLIHRKQTVPTAARSRGPD